jgi:hypothetical protein
LSHSPVVGTYQQSSTVPSISSNCCTLTAPAQILQHRQRAITKLNGQAAGLISSDFVTGDDVIWKVDRKKCPNASLPAAINANCAHPNKWMYTTNDGHLGKSCQLGKDNPTSAERAYGKYMLK